MKCSLLALALSTSCVAVPVREYEEPRSGRTVPTCVLPTPERALVFAWDEETPMAELVTAFVEVTGLGLVIDDATRVQLEQQSLGLVGLTSPVTVRDEEVYTFFEGVIAPAGFLLAPVHQGTAPVYGLYSANGRGIERANPVLVTEDEALEIYANHPALLVTATVELRDQDVRQLSTTLRSKVTDTRTQAILPVGEHGLHVKGTGAWVAHVLSTVRSASASSGRGQQGTVESGARD